MTASMLSAGYPFARSLRRSSSVECSRRASSRTAAASTVFASASAARCLKLSDGRLTFRCLTLGGQQLLADPSLDLPGDVGMLIEEGARLLLALADALAVVAEPGARLLDESLRHADVD